MTATFRKFSPARIGSGKTGRSDKTGLDKTEFAQDRFQRSDQRGRNFDQRNQPGHFDFYVLALSWSPSFCETSRERNQGRSQQQQCGSRPYSFVVHGLWPQHERGFPRDCQVPAPRLARSIVDTMLDLMPSPRLVVQSVGPPRHLFGPQWPAIFRDRAQGARGRANPGAIRASFRLQNGHSRRGRGSLRRRQSRPVARRHRRHLRQPPPERGSHLHVEGSEFPRLPGNRPPLLPQRKGRHASGSRQLSGRCMTPKKPAPDSIRDVKRFPHDVMLQAIQAGIAIILRSSATSA